jgi:hypothetical protein
VTAIVSATPSIDSAAGTSRSATCVVASTTRRSSSAIIRRTPREPVSAARISVCPVLATPARSNQPLLIGAVQIASTTPARASSTAVAIDA